MITERNGAKRQVHYLNNKDVVARWAGSLYRDIHYERSGTAGQPRGVMFRPYDKDNHSMDIGIAVDARPFFTLTLPQRDTSTAPAEYLTDVRAPVESPVMPQDAPVLGDR